jgi:hypothetical protein
MKTFVVPIYIYFGVILYILLSFGTFYGQLVYFDPFGMLYQETSGNIPVQGRVKNE